MKGSIRNVVGVAAVVLLGAGFAATASAQQDETQVVPLSDPSRPGKVELHILNGGTITVRGESRRDVAVVIRGATLGRERNERPAPPGMRRLTQSPGFEISEERNEIKIEASTFHQNSGAIELRVPLRTNLELGSVNGGTITVENVEGELEISNVNGAVVLNNVAGSVVANSQNGGVTATLSRVMADKAMAFTSMNGKVDVTLPSNLRATLKMRSDNGDIFTDFDVQLQQALPARGTTRRGGGTRIEVNRALYGTVNGGGPEIELRSFNGTIYLRKGQ
jgi:putative adhesin